MPKSPTTVTSTELARNLGEYLARVRYARETLVVEKNHTPMAEIRPLPRDMPTLADFFDLWQSHPTDDQFAADLDRVNREDRPMADPWA